MYDINFFEKTFELKKQIVSNQWSKKDYLEIFLKFEQQRNMEPYLFNIETTNKCNMQCKMCPRTTKMTRKIQDMDSEIFKIVSEQIFPHKRHIFDRWIKFIEKEMGISVNDKGENPFYFFISSQAVTMHGFGEPLLDPFLESRIAMLTEKKLPTYFSCNPSNINLNKIERLFHAGLKYIKFSLDSISDEKMREIRGPYANYTKAKDRILRVIDLKEKNNYPVTIVVCMIKISKDQDEEAKEFIKYWERQNVYVYIKSLDNQWYFKPERSEKPKSHYEYQYCEFPWTSLTVMVDGTVVPCTQDYNCEMNFGNVKKSSLKEIWNSKQYQEFRMMHITGKFPKNYKCKERCDLKKVFNYLQ